MAVTITINGEKLSAEPGMTVLETARAHDIYIPSLCYAPKLPPFGGCRLCVVEIERMAGFPTACTVPVADGMVVRTDSPALQAQRRETLSLLLSEHPYTCLTCPTKNGCVEFQGTIRKAAVTTGCQYCPKNGQCEVQQVMEAVCLTEVPYPISYRLLDVQHDDPFFDRDMNLCIVCGRCVRACQDIRHANVLGLVGRGDRTIIGTMDGMSLLDAGCQFCGACVDACPTGAMFDKKSKWEGTPASITPSICPYCAVGCTVNVQERTGRLLRAVGNDDGPSNDGEICVRGRFGIVDVVHNGARLKTPLARRGLRLVPVSWDAAIDAVAEGLKQYSGDEFAVIGSATATNEDLYMLQKLARVAMKSNNVALATAGPDCADALALIRQGSAPVRSIRSARSIMVIGGDPFNSHPIVGLEIRHALSQGAQVVTIDPRKTKLARASTQWLPVRPDSDHVLLAAMLSVVSTSPIRPDEAAAATGVDAASIVKAANLLAAEPPALIVLGSGVTAQPHAAESVALLRRLAEVLHAGIILLPGDGNMAGAYDTGMERALLPGYVPSAVPGRDYRGILDGIRGGQVKALYLAGDVPPLPELAQVPFLVVQGIVRGEVTKHAQVVLPATTFAEMDGTMTNLEGRVQRVRKSIDPVGEARPGWLIVQAISRRMGLDWHAESAADVLEEIKASIPAYAAVNYEQLGVAGTVRRFEPAWPASVEAMGVHAAPQGPNADFPLLLLCERNRFSYLGASLTDSVGGMKELKKENVLFVSRAETLRLGVVDGRTAKVESLHGSDYWTVQMDDGVPDGMAWASVNPAVGSSVFPGWIPAQKTYAIRVVASE